MLLRKFWIANNLVSLQFERKVVEAKSIIKEKEDKYQQASTLLFQMPNHLCQAMIKGKKMPHIEFDVWFVNNLHQAALLLNMTWCKKRKTHKIYWPQLTVPQDVKYMNLLDKKWNKSCTNRMIKIKIRGKEVELWRYVLQLKFKRRE